MNEEHKRVLITSTPSTNTLARELAGELPHLSVVRTDSQTDGRGQRGNSWEAEPGRNLTLSYVLKPADFKAINQFRINEGVALAVVDTLAAFGITARIKWPNDIYVGDKKICGILIEHAVMGSSLLYTIAGIGLNVNQKEFISDAPNPVSMLQLTGHEEDLDSVEKTLSDALAGRLRFLTEGEADIQAGARHQEFKDQQWRGDREFYLFEDLRVNGSSRRFEGRITDILPVGLLRIEDRDGNTADYSFKEIRYILS